MRARGTVAAVIAALLLAGCTTPAAPPTPRSAAPLVLPDGYADPGRTAPPVPDCETPEGRARHDPRRTLDPALLASDAAGRPTGAALARIRAEGLVVGVSQTTPLLGRRDQVTGRMEGYEIDIVNRIASRLFGADLAPDDPRLRLVTVPTGNRLVALKTEKNRAARRADPKLADVPTVDVVLANVTFSCDRVANHDIMYSTPYLVTNAGILTRSGAESRDSLAKLNGRKVCAASATTSIADLMAAREATGIRPVSVPDSSECLMLLQRGVVDAVYTDYPVLQGLHLQDPGTTLVDLPGQGGGAAGLAMSKDHDDLIRFVNGVLAEMRADGSLAQARQRWFVDEVRAARLGEPVPPLGLPPVSYTG
ncbi:transporter substrate-binding domain-containing protein [Saccharothrix obliqua]|uniref:transporter substrate-binding domain-containing protein n=1 Tax=Saccharothrix obliqua TaxID=2861747 RepID=UPI001C606DD8|nr:transporter substrate-binding domain-containing protein [Saccharothrix obliqua]MBW4720390.1 transporter substrate-binding domain-containing protein [Saccharothrix obliqua]